MKTNYLTLRKVVTTVAAGKLALSASVSMAQTDCGMGKGACEGIDADHYPALSLDAIGAPMEILTPPRDNMDWEDMGFDNPYSQDSGGKESSDPGDPNAGMIWAGDINHILEQADKPKPRIEFIVNGIRNDEPVMVILAYAITKDEKDMWAPALGDFHSGKFALGEDFTMIGGMIVEPQHPLPEGLLPENPLGVQAPLRTQSVHIPIDLNNLDLIPGEHIYFQAVILPMAMKDDGNFDFAESQASEVDHFIIERPIEGDSMNTGSKETDKQGSRSDEGSKNNDTTNPEPDTNTGGK